MLLSIPNNFTSNTTILSAAANANFAQVASVINGNLQEDNFGTLAGALNWAISGNVLALNIASASTTGIIVGSLTGVLASTKAALDIQSSTGQSTGRSLAYLNLSNGASTIPALLLNNAGSGVGLSITQSGAGSALKVAQSANAKAIEVTNSGTDASVKITDSGTGTAALEVSSTTKGVLPPRMTYAQRNAISAPAEGLEIYNTDSKCKQVYTGSAWCNIGAQCGDITASAKASPGAGYLACDGSAVSRTTYAELFAALSTSHGQGNGSTTFNLPDYRGRFLRMVDGSAGNDPDKASRTAMATGGNTGNNVGSVQGNATAKNGLALTDPTHSHNFGYLALAVSAGSGFTAVGVAGGPNSYGTTAASTGVSLGAGDNETRPLNAYVSCFIKF